MSKARKVTPEMEAEMRRLRDNGMTLSRLAKRFGVSERTIRDHTKSPDNRKNKLTVRPEWAQEWDEARMRVLGR